MIRGNVSLQGTPSVTLSVAGLSWLAVVDTGFNGWLELPNSLQKSLNARNPCKILSVLAAGQTVEEVSYEVDFPFDGRVLLAEATFVDGNELLLGTRLLADYRLEINFIDRSVVLERLTRALDSA